MSEEERREQNYTAMERGRKKKKKKKGKGSERDPRNTVCTIKNTIFLIFLAKVQKNQQRFQMIFVFSLGQQQLFLFCCAKARRWLGAVAV